MKLLAALKPSVAECPDGKSVNGLVSASLPEKMGRANLAVPEDQMQLSTFPLVFGGLSIYGSLTGTPIDTEDTLAFSVLENIRPMIETVPLEQAADAYARMIQGKARFRLVLVTKDGVAQEASAQG
jgi:alcohol dehydrogenase, propanol-preferring